MNSWVVWALASAVFAAVTALLAKVGVAEINSNFATFIRTAVVLGALAVLLGVTGQFESIEHIPRKNLLFLVLSGLATGASWLCYFRALQLGPASQVAPIDKLSLVLVAVFAAAFLNERLSIAGWTGIAMIAAGSMLVIARG